MAGMVTTAAAALADVVAPFLIVMLCFQWRMQDERQGGLKQ